MKNTDIKTRLIMPIQSAGQIGKSTALSLIIEYLKKAEIKYSALDADPEHKTLAGWHPESGAMNFREESDLLKIFEYLGNDPVELVDFPAQATTLILSAFLKYKAISLLAEKGVRITVLIFANEDQAGLVGAFKIHTALKDEVDYLVIENPEKFGSAGFWSSKVGDLFKDSPCIRLEKIEEEIVSKVKAKGKAEGRTLNFIEAADKLDSFFQAGLETWRDSSLSEVHKNKALILPHGVKPKGSFKAPEEKKQEDLNITDLF